MSVPGSSLVAGAGNGARRVGARGRRSALGALENIVARAGGTLAMVDRNPVTRRAVLSLFPRALEQLIVPDYVGRLDATLELRVFASRGGPEVRYTLRVKDSRTVVTRRAAPEANAWFGARLSDLIRIVTGYASWTSLLAAGRLQLGGDPFVALRAPLMFGFSPMFQPSGDSPNS